MADSAYTIRPGTVEDLAHVVPMWVELYRVEKQAGMAYALKANAAEIWREEAARRIGTPNFVMLVAVESSTGAIAGFVVGQIRRRPAIYADPLVGSLTELYVVPSHRGKGLASMLVKGAMEVFRGRGLPFVDALPVAGNRPSLALWESLGWKLDLVQYRFDLGGQA